MSSQESFMLKSFMLKSFRDWPFRPFKLTLLLIPDKSSFENFFYDTAELRSYKSAFEKLYEISKKYLYIPK